MAITDAEAGLPYPDRSICMTGKDANEFVGDYRGTNKIADLAVQVRNERGTLETGYSQSQSKLKKKRDLWIYGGLGSVQIVVLIKWNRSKSCTVKGCVEVFSLDPNGTLESLQKEVNLTCPLLKFY
jgi:hypothetical protein